MRMKLANPFKYMTFAGAVLYCFSVVGVFGGLILLVVSDGLFFRINVASGLLFFFLSVLMASLKIQYNICTGFSRSVSKAVVFDDDEDDDEENDMYDEADDFGDEDYDENEEFEEDPEDLGCDDCDAEGCPDRK